MYNSSIIVPKDYCDFAFGVIAELTDGWDNKIFVIPNTMHYFELSFNADVHIYELIKEILRNTIPDMGWHHESFSF